MSEKLTSFLTQLATDDTLVNEFEADKVATMKKHDVPDDHIQLVVNKQYDEIERVLGADYTIAKNGIITAFKK